MRRPLKQGPKVGPTSRRRDISPSPDHVARGAITHTAGSPPGALALMRQTTGDDVDPEVPAPQLASDVPAAGLLAAGG